MDKDFSYYDKSNRLNKLDLSIGSSWEAKKIDNDFLNTIFKKIDNGDETLQSNELLLLYRLLNMADNSVSDTKNNHIVDNNELNIIEKRIGNIIDIEREKFRAIQQINVEDFSFEKFKELYSDKYYISGNSTVFNVTSRETNQTIFIVAKYPNKALIQFLDSDFSAEYDNSGAIVSYYDHNKKSYKYFIADDLYADSKIRNQQTRAYNWEKNLKKLTVYNVSIILENYQKLNNGKSLIASIMQSKYIGINKRIELIKQIINPYYKFLEEKGIDIKYIRQFVDKILNSEKNTWKSADYKKIEGLIEAVSRKCKLVEKIDEGEPNGKIDGNFGQGFVGDCWLISAINGLANNTKGLKILNDSLRIDCNGNVYVTLKGVGKTYKITKEELEKGKDKYSYGDPDVRAIEIALEKYMKESQIIDGIGSISNNFHSDLEGNSATFAFQVLTGKGGCNIIEKFVNTVTGLWFSDSQIDNFNDPNKVTLVGAMLKSPIKLPEGMLFSGHAYAVIRSDADNVYLVNPWDTSIELTVSRKQFKSFFNQVVELKL